mgnify:FL=1
METDIRELVREWTVAKMREYTLTSVNRGATVRDAVERMGENKIGSLLVLDDGALFGIFTERDLLVRVLGTGADLDSPVEDFMTTDPEVVHLDDPIWDVLVQMDNRGYKHMPVIDRATKAPIGTIGVRCAVSMLAECLPNAIYNLPPDPGNYPASREGG